MPGYACEYIYMHGHAYVFMCKRICLCVMGACNMNTWTSMYNFYTFKQTDMQSTYTYVFMFYVSTSICTLGFQR